MKKTLKLASWLIISIATSLMTAATSWAGDTKTLPYSYGFENCASPDMLYSEEGWLSDNLEDDSGICDSRFARTGGYAFSFAIDHDKNNAPSQYLISPEFDGGGKKIKVSFYYKIESASDVHAIRVGYVTYSNIQYLSNPIPYFSDWKSVDTDISGWQLYERELPADARYIAIEACVSNYGLVVLDDFSFTLLDVRPPVNLLETAFTSESATFQWNAPAATGETISGYAWQYRKAGDGSWSAETSTTATSATISGLTADTSYEFRVKSLCESGAGSEYVSMGFQTAVSAVMNLPLNEDFQNGMGPWRAINVNAASGISTPWGGTSAYGFWGGGPQYLISPEIECSGTATLSFNYRIDHTNYPKTFQVGYSTTVNNLSAYVWDDTETTATSSDEGKYEAELPTATKFIAIKYTSNSDYRLFIDDISIIRNGAVPPSGPTPDDIGCNEATLAWTAPATTETVTGYAWQYKKQSESAWSATASTTATSVTITQLTADTEYDFRVKALYGSDESMYVTAAFTTAMPLPYEMNFEHDMDRWSMVDCYVDWSADVDYKLYTGRRTEAARGSGVGFMFFQSDQPQYLISPRFDSDMIIDVSFYYRNRSIEFPETFQVGYSTTTADVDEFVFDDPVGVNGDGEWREYENGFPTGTKYIAVKYTSNNFKLFLDDFSFTAHSNFARPAGIGLRTLAETEVTVEWNALSGVAGYVYQYRKTTGSNWSAEASVSQNQAVLTGLTPNTDYIFRVKALYDGGASNFETFIFRTEASAVSLPYTDGFEDGSDLWRLDDCSAQTGKHETDLSRNGENCFLFWPANQKQYLISPHLPGNHPVKVSFYHRMGSAFTVGYSGSYYGQITWMNTVTNSDDWTLYETIIPAGAQYFLICFHEDSPALYLDDFCFMAAPKEVSVAPASVLGQTKYVTTFFSSTAAYQLPEGVAAYTTGMDGNRVVFYRIGERSDVVPAGTAAIIIADASAVSEGNIYLTELASTDVTVRPGNILQGTDTEIAKPDGTVYVLGVDGDGAMAFLKFTGSTIPKGKAYYVAE
ncbi:MAG: fibronectin type III domain-containing protein [Bacteroidales bacterium]|nr:fibronectin type III domain-containing protein [Bacteroidales bacterium]